MMKDYTYKEKSRLEMEDVKSDEKENDRSPSKEEPSGPETKHGTVVNAPNVNLRRTPEFGDNVIAILQEGTIVEILQTDNRNFRKVKATISAVSYVGFISSEFIKEE